MSSNVRPSFSETVWPEDDSVADALLAACLMDREAAEKAVELLTPDDMPPDRVRPYRDIFAAITAVVKKGRKPAPPLVAEEMRRAGVHVPQGYAEMLSELAQAHVGGVSVEDYARILQRYSLRRALRQAGLELMKLSNDDTLDTEQYAPLAESVLAKATQRLIGAEEPPKMGEVILRQIEYHKQRKPGQFEGLKTGFIDLDALLQGLQPGELIILAGRPSIGKTALAQNISDNIARNGGKVLFVSVEMPDKQIANRVIASQAGVEGRKINGGLVSSDDWDKALETLRKRGLLDADYWVEDGLNTVPQIRALALRLQRRYGLDLIVVDYLQILKASDRYKGQRVQEVTEISQDLKMLAKVLGVPVIVLSQLTREVDKREDKRPLLSDLRDSGSIEQDADKVIFLYRDSYYHQAYPDKKDDPTAEAIVAKNRNGSTGTAKLLFFKEKSRFENMYGKQ